MRSKVWEANVRCAKQSCGAVDGSAQVIRDYAEENNDYWGERKGDGYVLLKLRCGHTLRKRTRLAENRARCDQRMNKLAAKVRTSGRRAWRPSREVKAAWRHLVKAQRASSFLKRAQAFVEAVDARARDLREDEWREEWVPQPWGIDKRRSRGGNGVPTVEWASFGSTLGRYEHGGFRPTMIKLNDNYRKRIAKPQVREELLGVLLHEVLHHLDALAGIRHDSHGPVWQRRLLQLEKMLGYQPAGGSRTRKARSASVLDEFERRQPPVPRDLTRMLAGVR